MKLLLKNTRTWCTLGAIVACTTLAHAVQFNYSSSENATINFDGAGNFSFTTTPDSFTVTSGTALGATGDINGTFAIGAPAGSTAPITGSGTFVIHADSDLTANLTWQNISQLGAAGGLNTLAANVNLTNITYTGTNVDLLALAANGTGITTLTFQFLSPRTLEELRTMVISNSFSGTVGSNVPDGGTTIVLLGMGLTGLALARRKLFA